MRQDWALAPQSKIKELDPARLRWWASVTDVRLAGSVPCNVVLSSPARDLEVYLVVSDIDNILDAQILEISFPSCSAVVVSKTQDTLRRCVVGVVGLVLPERDWQIGLLGVNRKVCIAE